MSVSLLDRTRGSTAAHLYERMGASPTKRTKALEREVQTLRRYLGFNARVPLGVELGDNRHQVNFDRLGRMHFYSSDDSISITRDPTTKVNVVNFKGNACLNAYNQVGAMAGATIDASGCDDFDVVGETGAVLRLYTTGAEGTPDQIQNLIYGDYVASGSHAVTGHMAVRDATTGSVVWVLVNDPVATVAVGYSARGST